MIPEAQIAAVPAGSSVWHILRHGWTWEPTLRIAALALVLCGVGLLARAAQSWTDAQVFGEISQPGKGTGFTFLISFICMLGPGFGFILAALERSTREMENLAVHDGLTGCLNRSVAVALVGQHVAARPANRRVHQPDAAGLGPL